MNTEARLGNYPFGAGEEPERVHFEFARSLSRLLGDSLFSHVDKEELFNFIRDHFCNAESAFKKEEEDRKRGRPNANLFYHNREHAVYQAGHDTLMTLIAILERGDRLSSYISIEGAVGSNISAVYHDIGFVYKAADDENYAARAKTHVVIGIEAVDELMDKVPVPSFLNKKKLTELVKWGIHATHFPPLPEYKEEAGRWLAGLDPQERKEAKIVRLAVQLGDLGGQVARKDYLENLRDLRAELNCVEECLGEKIIGSDDEINPKCLEFIANVIEPTVGKSARALFGRDQNIFSLRWQSHQNR